MECFWCLHSHWQPDGHCYQQDPAIFYVHIPAYPGFPDHYLHDPRFLAEYAEIYLGSKEKSLVLFIMK